MNNPDNPVGEALRALMRERGWSQNKLCEVVYGRDAKGVIRGSGGMSQIIAGKVSLGLARAVAIREKTGLDLTPYVTKKKRGPKGAKVTRAAQAVAAFERIAAPAAKPEAVRAPPPRFRVQINEDGTGSLSFSLFEQPAAEVLHAVAVLQAAGLIGPRGDQASTACLRTVQPAAGS